jgi:hypothetical protein
MPTILKPSTISGLATGHALYSNITSFLEFGVTNTNLVGGAALTTTNAAAVNDPNIGSARTFTSASSVTQQLSVGNNNTVLVVMRPNHTRIDSNSTFDVVNLYAGDAIRCGYSPYNGSQWTTSIRGNFGAYRDFGTTALANDAAFNTGQAVAYHFSATAVCKIAANGTVDSATNSGTTNAFSTSPLNCPLIGNFGSIANVNIGAIVVFNKLLSDAEMQSVTTDPWAMLAQAPALVSVDGDNSISQGQQDIQIVVNNIPSGNVPTRAGAGGTNGVGGTDFTGFSYVAGTAGVFTITADVPVGISTASSTQCYVEYAPE